MFCQYTGKCVSIEEDTMAKIKKIISQYYIRYLLILYNSQQSSQRAYACHDPVQLTLVKNN